MQQGSLIMASSSNNPDWNSAIYRGTVQHRRLQPKSHQFHYSLFMLYLDLDELPELFDQSRWYSARPLSARNAALARFRREDHLGDVSLPLSDCVRELVEQRTGSRPRGPIRLLTQLRYFGYGFNPVSFYYCFDQEDTRLENVVAEVNNTPWGEQHCYVLAGGADMGHSAVHHWQQDKQMHVSPFMPMDMQYDFHLSEPGEMLTVYMQNRHNGALIFDAGLQLQRQRIDSSSLRNALLRFPCMSLQVICAIHWQALRLWLKGVPLFTHPAAS
jgi:DUF1365 family protein